MRGLFRLFLGKTWLMFKIVYGSLVVVIVSLSRQARDLFLRVVYGSWWFSTLAAYRKSTSLTMLHRLVLSYRATNRWWVQRKIVKRGLTLDEFKFVFEGADSWVLVSVATSRFLSPDVVDFLLTQDKSMGGPVYHAASNALVSAERLREFVAVTGEEHAMDVLRNPNVPLDVLARFAASDDETLANRAFCWVDALTEDELEAGLMGLGVGEFVGLPRNWVLKALV